MTYELLVLGLMLLLIVGAVVDARLLLLFGLNALDHVVVVGGGAVAVDADAVKDFLGEAVGVAAVSASLSERISNCKKNRLRYKFIYVLMLCWIGQEDIVA
jgi:hypothetical protein